MFLVQDRFEGDEWRGIGRVGKYVRESRRGEREGQIVVLERLGAEDRRLESLRMG